MTNETAATGGVMYADEGTYNIDVRHLCLTSIAKFYFEENVEEMVGTTREAVDGNRVWRDETATRLGTRPARPAVPGRDRR